MRLVVFGLTISSSWGNGHATLWRGLCRALAERGHSVVFYERDLPFYAPHRDLTEIPNGRLVLFSDWEEIRGQAARDVAGADVAMVTSYCPDAPAATDLVLGSTALRVFYDLDTPVTLDALRRGETVDYVGPNGFSGFDLVLSYTGGPALDALRDELGAARVAPLYGHVDPAVHRPAPAQAQYAADLSYLGTYAADRQAKVLSCLVEPARRRPDRHFLIAGAQYPQDFPWTDNIFFLRHLAPQEHPAFYASSRLTLNVTRAAMAAMGWCPSGRLFEATACGAAVLSDAFDGLDAFYRPGEEILIAETSEAVLAALDRSDADLRRIAEAGRARTLDHHTSAHRAAELEAILESARSPLATEA